MKKLLLFFLLLLTIGDAVAQTKVQRGVVRKQKYNLNGRHETMPVQGVQFVVTGASDASAVSDANGNFSLNVRDNKDHKFSLSAVRPGTYGFLSPKKGEAIGLHAADLIYVMLYNNEESAAFQQKISEENKQKNKQQMLEIKRLRDQRDEALLLLNKGDAKYAQVTAERDSLQRLFTYYIENSEKIDKIVDEISEQLAMTDYQSLDSIDRQIYELKCAGEWKKVSDLINELMNGDADASLEAIQQRLRNAADNIQSDKIKLAADMQEKQEADDELTKWCSRMLDNIESLKMQQLNDSVSHCYARLVRADSTNWEYLNSAGRWEDTYTARYDLAMKYYTRAVTCTTEDTLKATSYNNIGMVYYYQGDYAKALENYHKALDICLGVLGENHPAVATCYNNIGLVYSSQGDYAKALENYHKALDICLGVLGENHPDVAINYNNIGGIYYSQGDYSKALEYYQKSLSIRLSVLGENHPDVAMSYNNIGMLYYHQGDYSKALEYYQKALSIYLSVLGENHPDVATSYNNIGTVYYSQGDYSKALEYYQKALSILVSVLGENHPDVATTRLIIMLCEYSLSLQKEQDAMAFMQSHAIKGTVFPNTPASQKGLEGDYYILSYGDWTVETFTRNMFDVNNALRGKPKTVVFYKNGEIREEYFENQIGMQFGIAAIDEQEKKAIVEAYHRWKENKQKK